MTRSEILDFISHLIGMLREQDAGWVVRQVAQSRTDDNIAELDNQTVDQILLQASEPAVVLGELLDALEIIIVETASMESEISSFFSEENTDRNRRNRLNGLELQLRRDNNEFSQFSPFQLQDRLVFTTIQHSTRQRQVTASNMHNLINQLRERIQ